MSTYGKTNDNSQKTTVSTKNVKRAGLLDVRLSSQPVKPV